MNMKRKITIREVAKYAGVSVASVSNVINGIDKTSEVTKEKILKAISEIGYQPDFTARSLAKGKSNLIGIMLPISEEGDEASLLLKNNPFFSEFISGIEYISRRRGYDVLITGIEKDQRCKEWIDKRNLDGIILLGMHPEAFFNEMQGMKLPIVLIDAYEEYNTMFHRITIDDELGGYIATKHLIDLGHRNIALATGSINNSGVNYKRFEGYKRALQETQIDFDRKIVFEDHLTYEGGYEMGKKILQLGAEITAVFAVADIVAFGVIKSFMNHGKNVPADYSIIGFDDIKLCEYMSPGLTTVRQDITKKGIAAAEAIFNDIEAGVISNENILMPIELIIRESTKDIR
jgi:LacI family transcriptional regulator